MSKKTQKSSLIKFGEKGYYTLKSDKSEYVKDLLTGRIRIYTVAQENRFAATSAYAYACRWARDACPENIRYIEKKLIEHCLIHDILDAYQKGENETAQDLYGVYKFYFSDDGMSLYDKTVGLI